MRKLGLEVSMRLFWSIEAQLVPCQCRASRDSGRTCLSTLMPITIGCNIKGGAVKGVCFTGALYKVVSLKDKQDEMVSQLCSSNNSFVDNVCCQLEKLQNFCVFVEIFNPCHWSLFSFQKLGTQAIKHINGAPRKPNKPYLPDLSFTSTTNNSFWPLDLPSQNRFQNCLNNNFILTNMWNCIKYMIFSFFFWAFYFSPRRRSARNSHFVWGPKIQKQ